MLSQARAGPSDVSYIQAKYHKVPANPELVSLSLGRRVHPRVVPVRPSALFSRISELIVLCTCWTSWGSNEESVLGHSKLLTSSDLCHCCRLFVSPLLVHTKFVEAPTSCGQPLGCFMSDGSSGHPRQGFHIPSHLTTPCAPPPAAKLNLEGALVVLARGTTASFVMWKG